jgi:septal ring-binding cell division protein DamX
MSVKKNEPRSKAKSSQEGMSRKQAIAAGALVVAVLAVLLLAAVLQTDSEADVTVELPEPTEIEIGETSLDVLPGDPPEPSDPAPAVRQSRPPAPAADPLAARASADLQRLRSRGGPWTLQFASMCDPDRVAALLGPLERYDDFYLVPAGKCYRVWWGRFASREQAVAASGVPAELRSIPENPFPRLIAEAIP